MTTAKISALIVEDDVFFQGNPIKSILLENGYDVLGIAETGQQAVQMAKALRPVVVIMDICLPDGEMAGAEAARIIQREVGSQIIFLTGEITAHDKPDFWIEVLRTRDAQFLTKPWNDTQLIASMHRAAVLARTNKTVFLCYAHDDRRFADEWQAFMDPLREVGIESWTDMPQIPLGETWRRVLEQNLARANAAVCLVSIHFVRSKFIREVEWPVIRQAGLERSLPVIPVFVGAVDQQTLSRIGVLDFQGVNAPDDPISLWKPAAKRASHCWTRLCDRLQARMR
jgi:CheY-like chemotaxis protein